MIACLLRLACAIAAAALLVTGCHYSEEEKWSVCCVLYVGGDTSGSPGRTKIIDWYGHTDFDGNGRGGQGPYGSGTTFYSNKDDKIRADIAAFLSVRRDGRAADYFIDLGMTCDSRSAAPKGGTTWCAIELPVQAKCGPTYRFLPGTTPIPERLQKPFAAVLRVSVNLSADTMLSSLARVDPVPGGQLCHRQP
jgi:hypothetical protein